MATIDRTTGEVVSGWDEVLQSIAVILTTPIGSRVMRRDFGSELLDLIDRPMTEKVVLAVYASTAQAIARWESRFSLTGIELAQPSVVGSITLTIHGLYDGASVSGDVQVGD